MLSRTMINALKISFSTSAKKKPRKYLRKEFLDSLRLYVRGGAGGNGLPKYGGIGGKGGDVYVEAKEDAKMIGIIKKYNTKRVLAEGGGHSQSRRILGESGKDIVIEAPIGVTVFDEFGRKLGELNEDGNNVLVAKGGPGGGPLTQFNGQTGQALSISLDLKLIADIGLVGFPNAGKSSLLKAISKAKPKVASYPFTTVQPKVGVINYPDLRQITMADLPGLIEGAHANQGLGHRFLKHIERTKLLLMVVDVNGFRLSPSYPHRSALETVLLLNKEMELYDEDLLKKPVLIAVNKMDTPGAQEVWQELEDNLKHLKDSIDKFPVSHRPTQVLDFWDIIPISALSNDKSIVELKSKLRSFLDLYAEQSREDEEIRLRSELEAKLQESGPRML